MIVDPKDDGQDRRRNSILDNDDSHPAQPAIGFISEERTLISLPAMVSVDQDPSPPLAHQVDRALEQGTTLKKDADKKRDRKGGVFLQQTI